MKLTCAHFNDLLLELAYDELDEDSFAQAMNHAEGCRSCMEALEEIRVTRKIAAQLPSPEQDFSWENQILDLARETAEDLASSREDDRLSDAAFHERVGLVDKEPGFAEKLRAFFLKPAFAAAAAACLLLVVSYGLYRNSNAPLAPAQSEMSGAPFLGPSVSPSDAPAKADQAPFAREEEDLSAAPMLASKETEAQKGVAGLGTTGPSPRPMNSARDLYEGPFATGAKAKKSAAAPLPAAAESAPSIDDSLGTAAGAALQEPSPDSDGEALYLDGLDAYNRGDCSTAIEAFQQVVDPPNDAPGRVPSALHHMGRCEKRSGHCAKALLYLENLVDQYPSYSERGQAMWEAYSCHKRLGHLGRAVELLTKLKELPGWADRASRELITITPGTADE